VSQNDDHIGQEAEDPSRTLDAVSPLYELGSHVGRYKLNTQGRLRLFVTASQSFYALYVKTQGAQVT